MNIHRRKKSEVRSQESGVRNPDYRLPTTGYHSPIRNPKSAIRNRKSAFTIIELLVVIAIIALLTGIIIPTVTRAKFLAYKTATRAYITQLETGALRYQQEHQCFPGQDNTGLFANYTASQVLTSELMGITRDPSNDGTFEDITDAAYKPSSPYVDYQSERLDTVEDVHGDDRPFTPIDSFPGDDASPLLYYPSRLGNDGRVGTTSSTGSNQGAFRFDDNESYTDDDNDTIDAFRFIIWDTRFGISAPSRTTPDATSALDKAYNADTFLIFGKALDDREEPESWFSDSSPKNF